ncbi:MAG: aminoacyl-tRNA hydrolase [Candidatus Eisenbacteria bacterium]|uniref:Peptidyl-tRNA hydrolase n=1 Tax=Eiseniibacteriota bacterium TaxID=2212470 RepID=A0A933SCI8_UNCEI|nr:aminoacyl-tRNA hydrolase [Candidatus Eisenbacteria bacterium]
MRMVLGLGNPGEPYARTRHNVAWWVLDQLAARHGATSGERDSRYETRRVRLGGHDVVLMKPLTFMNRSGDAWMQWRERHELDAADLLVVSDDVYLPLGALRLRANGSSGGHRGLESIEGALGHREYARLRFGVGAAESSAELREHVLEEFAPEEAPALEEAVRHAADAVECWVSQGTLAAMNQFNRKVRKEDSES